MPPQIVQMLEDFLERRDTFLCEPVDVVAVRRVVNRARHLPICHTSHLRDVHYNTVERKAARVARAVVVQVERPVVRVRRPVRVENVAPVEVLVQTDAQKYNLRVTLWISS